MGKTKDGGKTPFVVDAHFADVTGNETLRASAPGRKSNYLEKIAIQCPTMAISEWVKINDDDTIMIGKLLGDVTGSLDWEHTFKYPLKFAGAIKIDQEAADSIHITLEGFEA